MSELVAAIDQGTNTVRLLVADAAPSSLKMLRLEQRIVRLGGGFSKEGRLTAAAKGRALAALREYAAILKEFPGVRVSAVGTGVLRQASNALEFLAQVQKETGLEIEVIPGEREAETSVRGALWALGVPAESPGRYLVADVGGGSTEFALWGKGKVRARISVPVGVVSLTETFLKDDPPTAAQIEEARGRLRNAFSDLGEVGVAAGKGAFTLVGCSGTFTTIAALAQEMTKYDPSRITGFRLDEAALSKLRSEIILLPAEKRLSRWPGLPRGREDVIGGGLLLVEQILARFSKGEAVISDGSLLEGVLLEAVSRL